MAKREQNDYAVHLDGRFSFTSASTPREAVSHVLVRDLGRNAARLKMYELKERHGGLENFAYCIPEVETTGLNAKEVDEAREFSLAQEIAITKGRRDLMNHDLLLARKIYDLYQENKRQYRLTA